MNKLHICAFGKTGTKLLAELVRQNPVLSESLDLKFFINEKGNGTCDFVPPEQNHQVIRFTLVEDFVGKIQAKLAGSSRLLLVAGLGGANGGRQLLKAVKYAVEVGIPFSCFVVMPFSFEGTHRRDFAQQELCQLKKLDVALIVHNSDDNAIYMEDETSYAESLLNSAKPKLLEVIRTQIYIE